MRKANLSCCGGNCGKCKFYGNLCDGCNQTNGEAYWTKFADIPVCPTYGCCVNENGFSHCGHCDKVPCELYFNNPDMTMTPEEYVLAVGERVDRLNSAAARETGKCGYKCGKCKAFRPNVRKKDERAELQRLYKKYYDLDYSLEELVCDGCNCTKGDAKRLDPSCPIRPCVISQSVENCGDCMKFPCELFELRRGLSEDGAKAVAGCAYSQKEFDETLSVYDNLTNLK